MLLHCDCPPAVHKGMLLRLKRLVVSLLPSRAAQHTNPSFDFMTPLPFLYWSPL